MAWEMVRGDLSSASTYAYEWARRLLQERPPNTRLDLYTRVRSSALSASLAAIKMLPLKEQMILETPSRGEISIEKESITSDDQYVIIDTLCQE